MISGILYKHYSVIENFLIYCKGTVVPCCMIYANAQYAISEHVQYAICKKKIISLKWSQTEEFYESIRTTVRQMCIYTRAIKFRLNY